MIPRQLNIEVLKGVRGLKAIPPNFARTNPNDRHIWKFAVSVVDTISLKLESAVEFGKFIGPNKIFTFFHQDRSNERKVKEIVAGLAPQSKS